MELDSMLVLLSGKQPCITCFIKRVDCDSDGSVVFVVSVVAAGIVAAGIFVAVAFSLPFRFV